MTFYKDFLFVIQNFEISAKKGKNFRFAANIVREKILPDFDLEPFSYIKKKFLSHFCDGVLDLKREIEIFSFLPAVLI